MALDVAAKLVAPLPFELPDSWSGVFSIFLKTSLDDLSRSRWEVLPSLVSLIDYSRLLASGFLLLESRYLLPVQKELLREFFDL